MEETSSYCSGSPDRTVYTPVNGSYDDCYPQVMGQYPYLGENISGYDYGDIDKSHHTPLTSPSALRSTKCFDLKSLHDTFPESCEPYRGFFSSELSSNRYMPRPLDECSDSTRYLKLGDLDAAISGPALFKCLQVCVAVPVFHQWLTFEIGCGRSPSIQYCQAADGGSLYRLVF